MKSFVANLVKKATKATTVDIAIAASIFIVAVSFHGFLGMQRSLMPAGDTFNFIDGAQALSVGEYPINEKRPPFYSFLILLARPFESDPVVRAVAIAVVSGAAALAVIYAIGRYFKISRVALASFLVLASFDPLLSLYGVRPLSQGLFFALLALSVFLIVTVKPSRWYLITTGLVLAAMALTRLEGVIIAGVLWGFLFLKIPWKKALVVALAALILVVPWLIVVFRTTGSIFTLPGGGAYIAETKSGKRGTTDPLKVINGVVIISEDSWVNAWTIPKILERVEERGEVSYPVALLSHSGWLISILALIGLVWIFIQRPRDTLIYTVAFGLVVIIAAWYRPSGKYASPFISTWYFFAAAGVDAIRVIIGRLLKSSAVDLVTVGGISLYILHLSIVPQAVRATGVVLAETGQGHALYQAIKEYSEKDNIVLLSVYSPMSVSCLGHFRHDDGINWRPQKAVYQDPDKTLQQQREALLSKNVTRIIDDGSPELQQLINYLENLNEVHLLKRYYSFSPKVKEGEIVRVLSFIPQ